MNSPACEKCTQTTRLVGIERHADDPDIEVMTFSCDGCEQYATLEQKSPVPPAPLISQ